jgi:hypothetical protein
MIAIQEDILQSWWQLFELNMRGFRLGQLLQVLKYYLFFCQTEVVNNIVYAWRC